MIYGSLVTGVQLLCLTGKGADACRYLLSYGLCDAALWLAKATLTFDESLDIIKKCSTHYKNQGDWVRMQKLFFSSVFFLFTLIKGNGVTYVGRDLLITKQPASEENPHVLF